MNTPYSNFYKHLYTRTGGFIPTKPLNQNIYPGDFFQMKNGEMIVLGNIFQKGIIDIGDVSLEHGIKLNPSNWVISDGVSKPYAGRGSGQGTIDGQFEFSKQVLAFAYAGNFMFRANQPASTKILNWSDLQQQLIIKLTQTIYSFRELYLVTEAVAASDWTLAIAGSDAAELEIATDTENFGLVDIFGHPSARTVQSRNIEFYHRENKPKPSFFKAKKLVVQNEKAESHMNELALQQQNRDKWANGFFDNQFHYDTANTANYPDVTGSSILDMLQSNELNPNTALLYFAWADLNFDDINKLFVSYGN